MRRRTEPFSPSVSRPSGIGRARLGMILQHHGVLTDAALDAGLAAQRQVGRPLGEILRRRGDVAGPVLAAALAEQSGHPTINLAQYPADPTLSASYDPVRLIALGLLPWKRIGGQLWCAVAAPQDIERIRMSVPDTEGRVNFGLADRASIEGEIARMHEPALAKAARTRCPEVMSCRRWAQGSVGPVFRILLLASFLVALLEPALTLVAVLGWIAVVNLLTTGLRAFGLWISFRRTVPEFIDHPDVITLPPPGGLPVISLLVPLYRETSTLRNLVSALERSSYPKELLDVLLILEADDVGTPLALAQFRLPPWVRVLTAPPDTLKTKPRAMNYALNFARGTVVGIYDAEDQPEPAQLHKVARALGNAPPDVACVQGYLDFYNARQNWLARCFTVEYAIWFRVLLRGVQRLGIPIPLGGTTVFFRRSVLEAIGAWDAHNVTEDADLGMRLARFGYRAQMVDTTTFEEANCRIHPWIKQRARWLKGYAVTWVTHMRRPMVLWRDLGPRGFLGFQLLLLGGLTAYLATPLFWLLWAGYWGADLDVFHIGPPWAWSLFFASMIIGQAVMLAVAARAVWARPRRHLLTTVPLLALYWPLGAVAAYRAVVEVFTRPFYWAKTEHGL